MNSLHRSQDTNNIRNDASNSHRGSSIKISRRQFLIATTALTLIALLLRLTYHFGVEPPVHIAGDINDYVRYAWNLGHHGVYSAAPIDPNTVPISDGFRPPGYSLFLLIAMKISSFDPSWIKVAYALQILISTATVLLTTLLAKEWLSSGLALLAGVLIALWPHHIVFSSTLLSETLFGFCIIFALWLSAVTQRRNSMTIAAMAGIAFGYSVLVNSLMLLFPFAVAIVLIAYRKRRAAVTLLLCFFLLPATWWLASSAGPDHRTGSHRAAMNLVQGSWPIYHAAWRARDQHEQAHRLLAAIHDEIDLVANDPRAGYEKIRQRMSLDPAGYARWYLLEKPYLLWDWNIQLGWGGIHFLPAKETPMERYPLLRASSRSIESANPFLFLLGAFSAVIFIASWLRRKKPPFGALLVAIFTVYVTALHTALQAEPRYSIPYRPEQILMACSMLQILACLLTRRIDDNTDTLTVSWTPGEKRRESPEQLSCSR